MVSISAEDLQSLVQTAILRCDAASVDRLESVDAAVSALQDLGAAQITTPLLLETQAGKAVRKLKKHGNPAIAEAAGATVQTWMGRVAAEHGSQGASSRESSPVALKRKAEALAQPVSPVVGSVHEAGERLHAKQPKVELRVPRTGDPGRDKVRLLLAEALALALEAVPEGQPGEVAADVESAMFTHYKGTNAKYREKYRSLAFNLKDANNPDFRARVLGRLIPGEALMEMEPEEMASDTRKQENARIREQKTKEAERGNISQVATTDQFQCGRCKQRKTTFYQMQTRSADEPMTTFVTCVVCDKRWKFC